MAREAITVIGTVVGAYFGNPQLGYAIGSLIGNAVDPQVIRGPRLQEIPTQTASEGGHRSVVYGTSLINRCNIIDFGDPEPEYYEEEQGKGGPVVERERIRRTFAIGLGEPIKSIRMIRMDGKIVYDVRPGSTMLAASAAFAQRFTFYAGTEDQMPDPDLEALPHNGVGNTPAYRGTSYLVFPRYDLTDQQARIPTFEVEAVVEGEVPATGEWWLARSGTDEVRYTTNFVSFTEPYSRTDSTDPLLSIGSAACVGSRVLFLNLSGVDVADSQIPEILGPIPITKRTDLAPGPQGVTPIRRFTELASACASGFTTVDGGLTITPFVKASSGTSGPPVDIARTLSGRWILLLSPQGGASEVMFSDDDAPTVTGDWSYLSSLPAGCATGKVILTDGNRLIVVGEQSSAVKNCYSIDGGNSWTLGGLNVPGQTAGGYGFKLPDGRFFFGTGSNSGPCAVYSTALGSTWDLVLESNPAANSSYVAFIGGHGDVLIVIFAQVGTGLPAFEMHISNDAGSTFSVVPFPAMSGTGAYFPIYTGPFSEAVAPETTTLREVVADICDRCGIPAHKVSLDALTDEIFGITLGGPYDGAGAIASLMPAYLFDLFEADKKLHAVKRGAAVVATITEDDLIEEPDEGALRGQDIEYPRQLMLKYYNPAQNYAAPAAVVSRTTPDIRVRGEASIELPIAMDETEALNIANRMFKVMWEDLNGEVVLSVPLARFPALTATDNLGLLLRGQLYRIRAEKIEEQGRVLKITARRDRQSAYTSNLTAIPLPTPAPPPPSLAGETVFAVLNIPGIIDSDDQLGLRFAICGQPGTAWRGARIDYSVDGGANWTILGTYTQSARMGELLDPLPGAPAEFVDTTHTLRVAMVDDRMLESVTDVQLLQEGNGAAIVRADGTAELIQFRDSTDDGNREWSLDYLLRGRLVTDSSAHSAGAQFVMLAGSFFVPMPSALIGRDLLFRVTSVGNSPEDAPTYPFTWSPAHSQTEFPVALLEVDRAGGLVSASWSPRPRFGTEILPVHSVNFEGYRLLFEAGGYAEFHDTTATTYATSDAPFTGPITVTVYGLNRITGQGPGTSETTST